MYETLAKQACKYQEFKKNTMAKGNKVTQLYLHRGSLFFPPRLWKKYKKQLSGCFDTQAQPA